MKITVQREAAVLQGDLKCTNLVVSSFYDTKPVHYLSMVPSDLKWVVTEKYVFNVDTEITDTVRFLQMNTIHNYNFSIGCVDISDQLRGTNRGLIIG